jgi:hypothetical protein
MPPVLLGRSLLAYLVPYGVTVCVADPKRVSDLARACCRASSAGLAGVSSSTADYIPNGQRVGICWYRGHERFAAIASVCLCPVERGIGVSY